MLAPSTTTRSRSESTRKIFPVLPRSLPASIFTLSPFRTFIVLYLKKYNQLHHLFCERNNLNKSAFPQLARQRTKHAPAARFKSINQYGGIIIKANIRPILPAKRLSLPHNHHAHDIFFLHRFLRLGNFYRRDHHISNTRVEASSTA